MMMGVCLHPFCLTMKVGWDIVCAELGQGKISSSGACSCGVMYVEWYGVCHFVVICIDYGGVYVFHVCFDLS